MTERKDQMQTGCGLAETIDGTPIGEHLEPKPNGQQRDYVVLTAEERAKGFVEPVRRSYKHLKCGSITTMGQALAETYARCPDFYSGTFCCACGDHFPVGENGEFVWKDTDQKVGTRRASPTPCAEPSALRSSGHAQEDHEVKLPKTTVYWVIKRRSFGNYFRGPALEGAVYTFNRAEAMRFLSPREARRWLAKMTEHQGGPRILRVTRRMGRAKER